MRLCRHIHGCVKSVALHVLSSLIGESLCGVFRVHKVRHQAVFVSANHCMYAGGRSAF